MPAGRPPRCRFVVDEPRFTLFKPCGVPRCKTMEVVLAVDEFEALRLADLNGLQQSQAALVMGISRATFGRIIESARHKVIEALHGGHALRIEGGTYEVAMLRTFICHDCGHSWESDKGRCHTPGCPECGSASFGCQHKAMTAPGETVEECCGTTGGHHEHHGHGACHESDPGA